MENRTMTLYGSGDLVVETEHRLFYKQVMEITGDFNGHLRQVYNGWLKLDTGELAWRHPDLAGYVYYSDDSIRKALHERCPAADFGKIRRTDTRLTVSRVGQILTAIENAVWQLENPEPYAIYSASRYFSGTNYWDEGGPHPMFKTTDPLSNWAGGDELWPQDLDAFATVVHGGSEGYWLHVDTYGYDDKKRVPIHRHMLLAKSLGSIWMQCFNSAARISYMLQQPIHGI